LRFFHKLAAVSPQPQLTLMQDPNLRPSAAEVGKTFVGKSLAHVFGSSALLWDVSGMICNEDP